MNFGSNERGGARVEGVGGSAADGGPSGEFLSDVQGVLLDLRAFANDVSGVRILAEKVSAIVAKLEKAVNLEVGGREKFPALEEGPTITSGVSAMGSAGVAVAVGSMGSVAGFGPGSGAAGSGIGGASSEDALSGRRAVDGPLGKVVLGAGLGKPRRSVTGKKVRNEIPIALNLSGTTRFSYARISRRFIQWCESRGIPPYPASESTIKLWLSSLNTVSADSQTVYISAINAFQTGMHDQAHLKESIGPEASVGVPLQGRSVNSQPKRRRVDQGPIQSEQGFQRPLPQQFTAEPTSAPFPHQALPPRSVPSLDSRMGLGGLVMGFRPGGQTFDHMMVSQHAAINQPMAPFNEQLHRQLIHQQQLQQHQEVFQHQLQHQQHQQQQQHQHLHQEQQERLHRGSHFSLPW